MRWPVGIARAAVAVVSLSLGTACVPAWLLGRVAYPDEDTGAARSQIAGLNFATPARRSQVNCHGGVTVDLDVYPEQSSHLVDPTTLTVQGRFVAMVKNVGTARCNDLQLAPGDSVYWWMGPRGGDVVTDFYSIPAHGHGHRVAHAGPVYWYHDYQRPSPDAIIATIVPHRPPGDDGDDVEPLRFGHNSTWIACLGGCCESANMIDGS